MLVRLLLEFNALLLELNAQSRQGKIHLPAKEAGGMTLVAFVENPDPQQV